MIAYSALKSKQICDVLSEALQCVCECKKQYNKNTHFWHIDNKWSSVEYISDFKKSYKKNYSPQVNTVQLPNYEQCSEFFSDQFSKRSKSLSSSLYNNNE